jgi:hypothetical protein
MTPLARVVLLAGIIGVVSIGAGAAVRRWLALPDGTLPTGLVVLWAATGFAAARRGGLSEGLLAGGAVGLIGATVGLAISTAIDPQRPRMADPYALLDGDPAVVAFLVAWNAVIQAIVGAALGFLGAATHRTTRRLLAAVVNRTTQRRGRGTDA